MVGETDQEHIMLAVGIVVSRIDQGHIMLATVRMVSETDQEHKIGSLEQTKDKACSCPGVEDRIASVLCHVIVINRLEQKGHVPGGHRETYNLSGAEPPQQNMV
jgi:hypothetical protein